MIETYKIIYNDNEEMTPTIDLNTRSTRGNSPKMLKLIFNRDIWKFSFISRIVNIWNKLPEEEVTPRNLPMFKKNYRQILDKMQLKIWFWSTLSLAHQMTRKIKSYLDIEVQKPASRTRDPVCYHVSLIQCTLQDIRCIMTPAVNNWNDVNCNLNNSPTIE